MSNHFFHLLNLWHEDHNNKQWVLGSVYHTEGSAYRKAGAFMLFNDLGQKFGLLSGGCLEADLHRKAMQVLATGKAQTVRYNSMDEDDLSYQFGLGCGGIVDILLQPITAETNHLDLPNILSQLKRRETVNYWQRIPNGSDSTAIALSKQYNFTTSNRQEKYWRAKLVEEDNKTWLVTHIMAPPHLLVIGGGIDAQPVINMASQLGWEVTLADSRPANARPEYFPTANRIVRQNSSELPKADWFPSVNAAIIMTHNTRLDAEGLKAISKHSLAYCAMLGPYHRRQQVLELAQLSTADLQFPLAGPAGLDLGAELPEGIALSILAECHAVLYKGNGTSLNAIL